MRADEKLLWDTMKSKKNVGDTITVNEIDYSVISDESFAMRTVKEMSSTKYLYSLEPVILYMTSYKIIPENLDNCMLLIRKTISNLTIQGLW